MSSLSCDVIVKTDQNIWMDYGNPHYHPTHCHKETKILWNSLHFPYSFCKCSSSEVTYASKDNVWEGVMAMLLPFSIHIRVLIFCYSRRNLKTDGFWLHVHFLHPPSPATHIHACIFTHPSLQRAVVLYLFDCKICEACKEMQNAAQISKSRSFICGDRSNGDNSSSIWK